MLAFFGLAQAASEPPPARVEASSGGLRAVGTVSGDRMTIHVSRIVDNAPVRDAVVAVILRGTTHATTAEADGSYALQTPDLALPGEAAVQFEVTQGGAREELKGTLEIAAPGRPEDKNTTRQIGWWVLNFAVCIGFLMLWQRRKRARGEGP
jgi:hypothetical protein